jgi:hypothetical protein
MALRPIHQRSQQCGQRRDTNQFQLLPPYQDYTSINTGVPIASSNYNGLQTGFIYRLTDLQLNVA